MSLKSSACNGCNGFEMHTQERACHIMVNEEYCIHFACFRIGDQRGFSMIQNSLCLSSSCAWRCLSYKLSQMDLMTMKKRQRMLHKKKNIFMFITFLIWNGYCALPRHEEQITIKSSIISFSEFGYVLLWHGNKTMNTQTPTHTNR